MYFSCNLYVIYMYYICFLYVYLIFSYVLIITKFSYTQLEEFVSTLIGYKLTNATHILKLLEFMPVDYNLIKRVITSFNNLHYDKDTGILHSLPASRVHELRGRQILIALSEMESIALVTLAASIADTNSVLSILLEDYILTRETRKKGQKTFKHLYDYLTYILSSETRTNQLQAKVLIINWLTYKVLCQHYI